MSPSYGFGAKLPVACLSASQRITDDTDTVERPTAPRRLIPASTSASDCLLESIDSRLPTSFCPMPALRAKSWNASLGISSAVQNEGAALYSVSSNLWSAAGARERWAFIWTLPVNQAPALHDGLEAAGVTAYTAEGAI